MNLKGNNYTCPYCKNHLRANNKIIITAVKPQGQRGLILLDPKLGDYEVISHPSFQIKEGEMLDLFCPVCHENLEAKDYDEHLARVRMIDSALKEYDVLFSRIVGEKCTYKISDGNFEAYGVDSGHYTNFFGETPKY